MAVAPLRLFGVAMSDNGHGDALAEGTETITFRDMAAVVGPASAARADRTDASLGEYREIIDAVFSRVSVLPAPAGVVFRSRDVILRWMELHYVTLHEALAFVDNRVAARVHVSRTVDTAETLSETTEVASDIAAIASGSFRVLRRHAVASVPLRSSEQGLTASAAFLVDRDRWPLFADVVREEDRRLTDLSYHLTGPWPPYDFVRMQFGG